MTKKLDTCVVCGKRIKFHWHDRICWDCWRKKEDEIQEDLEYDERMIREEDHGT